MRNVLICRALPSFMGLLFAPHLLLADLPPTLTGAELSLRTFDDVWTTINESYYDPDFGELDWESVREKYRPRAEKATSPATLRPILNKMLGELGESHFGVMPARRDREAEDSEPDTNAEEDNDEDGSVNEDDDSESASGDYTGLHLRLLGEEVVIVRVDAGSPASEAGFRAGLKIRKIGKLEIKDFVREVADEAHETFSTDFFVIQSLKEVLQSQAQDILTETPRGKVIEKRRLRPTTFSGKRSTPFANMPALPIVYEERTFQLHEDAEAVYVRFNIFLPNLMEDLRRIIKGSREAQGLIIDVRGNPGGLGIMANGLAGILTEEQFSLGDMDMREGDIHFIAFPQKNAYLGPVAILIDSMSASTSEIFAAGLQEAGRARVFGRRTMGAALPSYIRDLPNGDQLQYAIADFTTPKGRRIEGEGVIPDVVIPLKPRKLMSGQDPDLEKALKWLRRQAKKSHSAR